MFDIFAGLFDWTLLTWKVVPGDPRYASPKLAAYAAVNTVVRASVILGFTYGAIRVVATAVAHGSF